MKRFLAAILSVLLVFTVPLSAYAIDEAVDVTIVEQAATNWCWAACAEMAGVVEYPSTDRDQWDVVKELKGNFISHYPNESGSIQESAEGSEYITYDTVNFTSEETIWTFSEIVEMLRDGHVLQAGAGYYDSNGNRNGGHVVVIHLITTRTGEDCVQYVDPWDGTRRLVTYAAFCNGSYNGRRFDQVIYVN